MARENVFFMNLHAESGCSLEDKFRRLLNKAGIDDLVGQGELVGIKVHVGERGNLAYINHNYARLAVSEITRAGGKPFLTDTNTLYGGGRHNAVDHHASAVMHGYFEATTGAPFFAADGLRGLDFEELPVKGRHMAGARIAAGICQADKIVMLSHFKGHCEMGFGGSIKNMGMGCASVPGKLELHSGTKPVQDHDRCVGCGQCLMNCPEHAIVMAGQKAVIDYAICIGCGQCVAACNYGAMQVKWAEHGERLIEKVAEYAAALYGQFSGKALYVNFALDISPDCDCWDYNDRPFVPDIGILASRSPAALDRATMDLVKKANPQPGTGAGNEEIAANPFDALRPGQKCEYLFEYCRTLGMNDEYELVEVG
jgi:uncharacterized Fe-S center protein